jgi:3D (Asp-Asp-Asp) domain-containing protein
MKLHKLIIVLLLSLTVCATILAQNLSKEYKSMFKEITGLKWQIEALQAENTQYKNDIKAMSEQIEIMQEQVERKQDKVDMGGERLTSLGKMKVTGYCKCQICCGDYALNRPNGIVYGASGTKLIEGVSVASPLPLGTRLKIGERFYIVHDRTSEKVAKDNNGLIVDIYSGSHKEAWNVGNEWVEVFRVE